MRPARPGDRPGARRPPHCLAGHPDAARARSAWLASRGTDTVHDAQRCSVFLVLCLLGAVTGGGAARSAT